MPVQHHTRSRTTFMAVAGAALVALAARPAGSEEPKAPATRLGVKGTTFTLNEKPTFLLAKRAQADALAAELGLRSVRRSRRFALLANPEAAERLAAAAGASGSLHAATRDSGP